MESILELNDLSVFTPQGRQLANRLNANLHAGELLLIEGENGSGKTTLLKTVLGLSGDYRGEMKRQFSDEEVAYLPQLANVQFLIPLTLADVATLRSIKPNAVNEIGLLAKGSMGTLWNTASGGERQKALLTGVFAQRHKLLVLDEPFNHLDQLAISQVVTLIRKGLEQKLAVILVSHNAKELSPIAKHRIELRGAK